MSQPVIVRAVLKSYPHTAPLKTGAISSPDLALEFTEIDPIHRAFAPMARTQDFDMAEMAIVTYLLAKAYDKPIVMLPAVVAARFQLKCIIVNERFRRLTPDTVEGARVGVRAYTQTTGMWVRGILAADYGVPVECVRWVTFEDAHLAEYQDPAFVERAPPGAKLLQMLRDGALDAAILGNDLPDEPGLVSLFADPAEADQAWYGRHGFVPINHVVVVTKALAQSHPEHVRSLYRLLQQGKAAAGAGSPDKYPFGVDALREPMALILDYCERQHLLPRRLTVDEVFTDTIAVLGNDAF